MGILLVAHSPERPPCVKNGDITGSTLSGNAAMCKIGDITGSTFSGNAAVCEKRGMYWKYIIRKYRNM